MVIIGIDGSKNGSGIVAFEYDNDYKMIRYDYLSFTQTMKRETEKILFHHKKKSFNDDLAKLCWTIKSVEDFISNFTKDCNHKVDYAAIEGYSFNSPGFSYDKGEICGALKRIVYEKFNANLRIYSPKTIKKFASSGNNNKTAMCEQYMLSANELELNLDRDLLVANNDLVDAYWIAKLLEREILLRNNKIDIKDLAKREVELFGIKKKDPDKNYLYKPFDLFHTNLF